MSHMQVLNLSLIGPHAWLLAVPVLLFIFYLVAWLRIGPEPAPSPLVVAYDPPDGLSPAAVRYVATGTTDGRSFAAVLAQLAVRGCIRVEPVNGKYKISRLMNDAATQGSLAPEEKRVLRILFSDGQEIELSPAMDQRNTGQNSMYVAAIHNELNKQPSGKYLNRHSGIIAVAILSTFALSFILAAVTSRPDTFDSLFFTLWILFAGLLIGMLFELSFMPMCRAAVRGGKGSTKILSGVAPLLIFGTVIVFLLTKLADTASLAFALMLPAMMLVNLGWAPCLKRKSALGHKVSDQIAGFRKYLQEVEQDRLDRLNHAQEASANLDRLLPYAIALEVKEDWGDSLAQMFAASTVMVEG
ncbi:MAG: DUF2207 family protein [Candidatus Acidiferrales bacterium]